MTTIVANTFNWVGLAAVATYFKNVGIELQRRKDIRETIKELHQLSDYELNDIGIARGDIYGVATGDDTLERTRRSAVDSNTNLKGWV